MKLNFRVGGVVKKGMKVAAGAIVAVTTAFAGLTLKALSLGGDLEQSIGGIETLFKKSADTVITNSKKAYLTAGLDANNYMQQVTSFSASLLQSLGGDTEKAAKVADMAVIDMADNANKMGSAVESIQNAYQGFAKQNYTMLDNLKLGYGGTKTEMLRLLDDAEKLSGIKYDISNLNDVYQAIHVIQTELDITGTTAKEGMDTLTGAIDTTKAAFSNFLSGAGNVNDFVDSFVNLAGIVADRLKELIPRLATGLFEIVKQSISKLSESLPPEVQKLVEKFANIGNAIKEKIASPEIVKQIDKVKDSFAELSRKFPTSDILDSLATGFLTIITIFIDLAVNIIPPVLDFFNWIIDNMGTIAPIVAGVATAFATFQIISAILPIMSLLQTAFTTITTAITVAGGVLPALGTALSALISPVIAVTGIIAILVGTFVYLYQTNEEFRDNIITIWESIKESISGIIDNIIEIFNNFMEKLADNGTLQSMKETFINTWETIKESLATIFEAIFTLVDGIFNAIENFLSEHGDTITNILVGAWTYVWGIVEPIIDELGVIISTLSKIVKEVVNTIVAIINGDWSAVWEHAGNIIDIFVDFVSETINNWLRFIEGIFKDILKVAIDVWSKITTTISEKVSTLVKNITKFFNDLRNNISVALGNVLNKIIEFGTNFTNWVQNDLPKIINNLLKWFTELPRKIWAELLNIISDIQQFASDLLNIITTEIPKTTDKIISTFEDIDLFQIGKDIITGLINGITSMAGNVWSAVKGVAGKIITGVTDTLAVQSPSKVMIEIGENVSIGLADGINNKADLVKDAATSSAKSIIDVEIETTEKLLSEIEKRNKELASQRDIADAKEKISTAKKSKDRKKAQQDLNEKLRKIEEDALKERLALLKEEQKKQEEILKDASKAIDELQDAIAEALKRKYEKALEATQAQYDKQLKVAEKAYDKEVKVAEKASDSKLKALEDEYNSSNRALELSMKEREKAYESDYKARINSLNSMEKAELESIKNYLSALDGEKNEAVQRIQEQINAIDALTDSENKASEETAHQKKLSELSKTLSTEENAEKRAEIQESIDNLIAGRARKDLLEQRKEEKESLKQQISQVKESFDQQKEIEQERTNTIKDNYSQQKETIKNSYDAQKQALKDYSDTQKQILKDNYDNQKSLLQEEISNRKIALAETFNNLKNGLSQQLQQAKEHHKELTMAENLMAEAKKMINDKNQQEIMNLLDTYFPLWREKGRGAGEQWLEGLTSVEGSIKGKVDEILSYIDQVQQAQSQIDSVDTSSNASPSPPKEEYTSYTVKKGDNLTKIAKVYGTTVDAIADSNNLSNKNLIQIGQTLKIPLFEGLSNKLCKLFF